MPKKIAVVGLKGKWSTDVLAEAVEEKTGSSLIINMEEVRLDLNSGQLYFQDHKLSEFDGIIVKKISAEYNPNTLDRLELLRVAENAGVRVFSPALHILRLIDRLSCTVTLANHAIPMPETVITESVNEAVKAIQNFGSAVLKPLYSTKARGMILLDASETDLYEKVAEFKVTNQMMYIQKKIAVMKQDYGMVFLGGEYLGTYARVKQGDTWNTTINSGGKYAKYEPSAEVIQLASKAQAAFEMDFTTVDVAETDEGPVIFEVSAFGGFRGAKEGIGIDAAGLYVDYVLNKLDQDD